MEEGSRLPVTIHRRIGLVSRMAGKSSSQFRLGQSSRDVG